ncbi:OmpA family protein [Algoriphagus halophytocola]|uniref:OmpA family protein n=1 Tax=Algoriphagus halophytocola TaxID=2991499 RepID=A0ABY6MCX9_9BACT|nr:MULTISPECIES: OmpA family protein [unclassified Algoriphagus]UZD20953.1 OmpA family protein [Algoriphagus sp. TR-M5]WBL42119.1 OmpA family protein [Algoriphagus sp. TR-M9]
MKKYLLCLAIAGLTQIGYAQTDYNRWSLETNAGFNKPMAPLTPGYLSPTLNIGHLDFGVRYMFNEHFGIKADGGFGSFSEAKDESPEFTTNYFRANLQGVANLGRIMNFQSFTRTIGFLGHAGVGGGRLSFEQTILNTQPDYMYNFIVGFTGQAKLGKRVALTGDISMIHNGRQTYTFDGNQYNAEVQPIDPMSNPYVHAPGTWWTGTLGLNFYLGKHEAHADWYVAADKYATKEELATQINGIKDMLKDSDGDGVPDYLDKEPNTPAGARVDSAGMTMDSDGDGTPDHMDKCPFMPGPASTDGCHVEEVKEQLDFFKKAIKDGYVNVYYAFDSAKPLGYSASAANYVSNFLKKNPGVSVEVKGYADELGPEDYNMKLSERRAKAVYDLLVASGVDASRLSYKGYGEDTSVDKSSADARQMARRASFEIK